MMRERRQRFLCAFPPSPAARDTPRRERHHQPKMNWREFLLISGQDSFARIIVPNLLPRNDRLTHSSSAFDAASRLRDQPFDAIFVALDESDQDAAVVVRTLRRQTTLPIIMIVTAGTRDQVTRGYRLGADAHIELPCDP